MILSAALVLICSGVALLGYLLWQKFPLNAKTLTLSDLVGIAALSVALVSLYVSFETQKQAIKDSEEQQKSLESSRQQLQDVAETLKGQQETLNKNLETSKDLFQLQKEQQAVLTKSLEITKNLYQIQKEERERVLELASRKPQMQVVIGSQEIVEPETSIEVSVDKNNNAVIPLMVKNVGTASLIHPGIHAIATRKDVKLRLEGASFKDAPNGYRSEVGGLRVKDMLTFKSSRSIYESSIYLSNLVSDEAFDIYFSMDGENLEQPFRLMIRVKIKRELAS